MPERNAYLYLNRFDLSAFEQLTMALQQSGFSLYHPESGMVTAVRTEHDVESDEELIGDHMPVTLEWLVARVERRIPTSLEWWGAGWQTIYCALSFGEQLDSVLLGLNGIVDQRHALALFDELLSLFAGGAASAMRGLVIDPEGITEEYDWLAFFAGRAELADPLPSMVVVPAGLLSRVRAETAHERRELPGGFTLLSSPAQGELP